MRDSVSELIFSMFTSSERAEAISGDLMEEREQHGSIWFWSHVLGTTLALWRSAATEAPLRVFTLMLAGCVMFMAPAFGGTAAVFLFPQMVASLAGWMALSFFWWGGALWAGATLVTISPRRGMAACATLAAAAMVLMIGLGATAWHDFTGDFLLFYMSGLATTAPLLAGGAIARRRQIARSLPTMEHQ